MNAKLKIHLAQINTTVGDLEGNVEKIMQEHQIAEKQGCDLVIFCEMTISGYPCEDLWHKKYFIKACQEKAAQICERTESSNCAILLGCPTLDKDRHKDEITHNSALLIDKGEIKIINKKSLPNYGVFDENRYFKASPFMLSVEFRGLNLTILICEDMWQATNIFLLKEQITDAIFVINSSPYSQNKYQKRIEVAKKVTTTLDKPLIYLNQVGAQDSVVFDGSSFVMNSTGEIALQMKEFVEDFAEVEIEKDGKIIPKTNNQQLTNNYERNYSACVLGLRDYIQKNGFKKVLLGMSGGIDSALVATIAVDALGSENVSLYALPSRFNSDESMMDAKTCAKNLDVNLNVISIEKMFEAMLETVEDMSNLAKENSQSRIRGNILMALSNSTGALLLSTGNKSEMACGYATIYGDMCGAFNPIKDLYKTEVFDLAKWRNENIPKISTYRKKDLIPQNIIEKEPTAELRENQKDSDSLPDYETLDQILFNLIEEEKSIAEIINLGFEEELVKKVAKLFYASEYKRKQAVIGPKISRMSFDKDRRYQMTNKFTK